MENLVSGFVDMISSHWFWAGLTLVCLLWYSTVTIYVAIKGMTDIRTMLRKLGLAKDRVENE